MAGFLSRLFGGKSEPEPQFDEAAWERYMDAKEAAMEAVLGPMADTVMHAVVPFDVGGGVDIYYYPQAIAGTALATMEVVGPDGSGPQLGSLGPYELVAFTKHPYPPDGEDDGLNAFTGRMYSIFTMLAFYSREAVLQPLETIELPGDEEDDGSYLVLDEYRNPSAEFTVDGQPYGLLLCIEVFHSEMQFAREHGSEELLERLKQAGHYPFSDLDREPVA